MLSGTVFPGDIQFSKHIYHHIYHIADEWIAAILQIGLFKTKGQPSYAFKCISVNQGTKVDWSIVFERMLWRT